ncbi:MAG TPA: hypothetical protein VN694_14485 [Caulobacteraceae bacterium]|nr:hypothetical protein [Caulobacteraceae bacterium]
MPHEAFVIRRAEPYRLFLGGGGSSGLGNQGVLGVLQRRHPVADEACAPMRGRFFAMPTRAAI